MKERYGGTAVRPGIYLNLGTGEYVERRSPDLVLPGAAADRYVRVPKPLAAILIPFTGLAFVIFVPLMGFVAVVGLLAYKVRRAFRPARREAAAEGGVTAPDWAERELRRYQEKKERDEPPK